MSIFWSWQSDLAGKTNRHFVKEVLEVVVEELRLSDVLDEAQRNELEVDHDRKGVPGIPDLAATIFGKIEKCSVLVADVSVVGTLPSGKAAINSNVGIELGYALHALSSSRVLLVANAAFTEREKLPFDLRHKGGPIFFNLPDAATKSEIETEKKKLVSTLKNAIQVVIQSTPKLPSGPNLFTANSVGNSGLYFDVGDLLFERGTTETAIRVHSDKTKFFYIRVHPKHEVAKQKRSELKDRVSKVGTMSRNGGFHLEQNKWGAIAIEISDDQKSMYSATQLFVSGEIWSFESYYVDRKSHENDLRGIPTGVHESLILNCVMSCMSLANKISSGPYVLEIGMLNANGNYLFMGNSYFEPYWGPIQDSKVILKKEFANAFDKSVKSACLEFFEQIFDSAGHARPDGMNGITRE